MMSVIWSPIPTNVLFEEGGDPPEVREVQLGDVTLVCSVMENGMGRVERLISPRATDYLNVQWQPGTVVPLWGNP